MTKRKPESDLSMEESMNKKGRIESLDEKTISDLDLAAKITFPGLINFANYEKRKKYFPDTTFISKDEIKIYYHKNKLVDIEYFDKIYNGSMEESKTGIVNLNFDAYVIIIILNYIENPNNFEREIKQLNGQFGTRDEVYGLTILANYIQHKKLEELCYQRWAINKDLNLKLIELYDKHGRDKKELMIATISGTKTIENDVPKQFLSDCYDLGITSGNNDSVILNVIPYYDPTEQQLSIFKYNATDFTVRAGTLSSVQLKSMKIVTLKNVGSGVTIQTFLERYKNTVGNPGVTKFLHLLATFMIT